MRRSYLHILLLVSAGWIGCSSDRGSFGNDRGSESFQDPDAGGGLDGGDAGCSGLVCSRDLRSVLNCSTGSVVMECPPDKACGSGECIEPCNAAAMNEGSVGCSFASPGPVVTNDSRGSCHAVFVANNWTTPATLQIEVQGETESLDGALWEPYVEGGVVKHRQLQGPIPPGSGAVVFVAADESYKSTASLWIGCPEGVKPILDKDQSVYGSGIGHALFARTDVPVSMYSIFPYGGALSFTPSGTLLYPTTSFRTNYVVASSWGGRPDVFGVSSATATREPGIPTLQFLATEDDTTIDFLPRVDIIGGNGVPSSPSHVVATYKLQRGEVLQLAQNNELVGSIAESSKPIAVFGGHTCMKVPADVGACDGENKQIPPLSAWGHEYAVLPAPNRSALIHGTSISRETSVIRLVGAVNGTQLVYEPAPPALAPAKLDAGESVRFFTDQPFVVRSQDSEHPFYAVSVMTGADSAELRLGDPETAVAVPTDQWLDSYGFFADYSYQISSVFVTRRKSEGAFRDVELDCTGVLTDWKPIGADYEWTSVVLTRGGQAQTYPGGTCYDGAHRIHSAGAFSMAVWGVSTAASYSYPGGTGLRPVTPVHAPVR
jgi:IgGFc binding protein